MSGTKKETLEEIQRRRNKQSNSRLFNSDDVVDVVTTIVDTYNYSSNTDTCDTSTTNCDTSSSSCCD